MSDYLPQLVTVQKVKNDPYQTLGVNPNDSYASMKKAWKAKVRTLHPDANNDPEAAGEFLALTKAWKEICQDIQNRDQSTESTIPPNTPEHQPFFSQTSQVGSKTGENLHLLLSLNQDEAKKGGSKKVLLHYKLVCKSCLGSGKIQNSDPCSSCHGMGRHHVGAAPCYACAGTGRSWSPCVVCAGHGTINHTAYTLISWPANTTIGAAWRVPRQGAPGISGAAPGDLFVEVVSY